mgnify:FL=1
MSKFKFKLNRQGVRNFLRSESMQQLLLQRATEIKNRAGDGYEVSTFAGKNRANATVKAATVKAKKDNKKNNTLLKAVR